MVKIGNEKKVYVSKVVSFILNTPPKQLDFFNSEVAETYKQISRLRVPTVKELARRISELTGDTEIIFEETEKRKEKQKSI